jgi:hypothetical protein
MSKKTQYKQPFKKDPLNPDYGDKPWQNPQYGQRPPSHKEHEEEEVDIDENISENTNN